MLKKYLNNKGFSLAELLIVVIIVISVSVISFNYYKLSLEKSKAAEAMMMLRQVADAQIVYYRENRVYTDDITELLMQIEGEETTENGHDSIKSGLFSYWAESPSSNDQKEFTIACAKRGDRYEIYAIYNKEDDSLKFDASALESNGATTIDIRIVESIQKNGKL